MAKYKATLSIESVSPEKAQELASLLQHTVNVVDINDLTALLHKVKGKPGIVKTALKFV